MLIQIKKINLDDLAQYATVPMAFEVQSVLKVDQIQDGLGGLALREEKLETPYIKDYDADFGNTPTLWAGQFDLQNWGIFLGIQDNQPIAGIAVAYRTPDTDLCEGRDDLAVLWDIRVHPHYAQRGIGSQMFQHGVTWAREKGCTQLKIETQNINIPACRFYAKQVCHLGSIHQYAYQASPDVQHEMMLLWYLKLQIPV